MSGTVTLLATGVLTTLQDEGRRGYAALGVGRSGACDRSAHRLANRLVGNHEDAATLEVTFGGLVLRADRDLLVVTTGARCQGDWPHNAPARLLAGRELRLGAPVSGLRTYVAVRGGFAAERVLGSCSTDVMSGLGPAPLEPGATLPVSGADQPCPGVDLAPVADPVAGDLTVRITAGPRRDWFGDEAWALLTGQPYVVSNDSNRVGLRLEGDPLERLRTDELPSEGLVRGALQIPPSGRPVLFLADHPATGGYPVIGYVDDGDVDACGQLRPGQRVHLRGR
ncbi:5-oxoprolinase subunit C family protein [Nocardioides terrisoli]|uniref:5-oxoprolinase subunit C family protein n=1 Tax=Nocardioides terrisoli TaxID=3388267 RepID=UPI00287BA65C|nr:biotin-dependent carboxyltransferase family protein [Nocardioides marmorisolisilvae]